MSAPIKLKRSAVPAKVPVVGDLILGELAMNTYDGRLFFKKDDGAEAIVEIATTGNSVLSVNGDTGTVVLDADDIDDASTTNKFTTAADISKLAGIEAGATANSSDATLLNRANHTGTQLASTISDFTEAAQDAVGSILTDSATIDFTYDDGANTITGIVVDGSITNAKVASGIAATKIGAGTVSDTEFGYLDGATSNIQTQLNGKQATITDSDDIAQGATNLFLTTTERNRLTQWVTQASDTLANSNTTYNFNLTNGSWHKVTVSSNCTFSFTMQNGFVNGLLLEIQNGGGYTITWPASIEWATGEPPTLTTTGYDHIMIYRRGTPNTYYAVLVSQDVKV